MWRRGFWAGDQFVSEPSCYEASPVCGVFSACITSLLQMYRITQLAHCSQYPPGPGEWEAEGITCLHHQPPALDSIAQNNENHSVCYWASKLLHQISLCKNEQDSCEALNIQSPGIEDCENCDMHLFKLRRLSMSILINSPWQSEINCFLLKSNHCNGCWLGKTERVFQFTHDWH